ncbi:matrix metalloproteinase-28 [Rhineura floridana]|uniref:matrix metalloproteinase-28 n=1 Tax=Rhineura floridana TaxID=261503 RepID=UPI002AC832ED|nr:matrix metalloproteinase-28 [Rhineura floridana]
MAAAPILALLLLLQLYPGGGSVGSRQARAGSQQAAAERFLKKYGYFWSVHQALNPAKFSEAIREFQWVSHLPLSGVLDASTVRHMNLPRCGVNDAESRSTWKDRVGLLFSGGTLSRKRRKRFSHQSGKWHKRHLTYRVVNWPWYLPQQQVRQAVKAAFELWSNASALVFWEAAGEPADIRLTFFQGDHNDGVDNAFDGPGGALAHAFFPRRGEAHFDNDERWSLDSGKGRNLFVVVAHEIGHTLGLEHSPVRNALMSPYYKKLGKDFVLNWDDILSIQNLYGKPLRGSVVQLPGKLFAHFQGWSQDLEGTEHRNGDLSSHYCWSFFDAITTDLEGNLYILKGGYYWIASKGVNPTGPHLLRAMWPGLPSAIDAAAFSEEDGKFYFFKGGRCWRYKGSSLEVSFPRKCSSSGDLPRHPDTALYFQPLGHLVLFKGPKYYVVNEESLRVEPYYPRSLRDWGGVPAMANGAHMHSDGFVYFFRNDRFWKFDPDNLQVVETGKWASQLGWLGCRDMDLNQAVA